MYIQFNDKKSGTKNNSTKSENPKTSMHFHVCKINYATASQHIIITLASVEVEINRIIYIIFSLNFIRAFQSCIDLNNLEQDFLKYILENFTIYVNGKAAFSKFLKVLAVEFENWKSKFHLNCTVHAST